MGSTIQRNQLRRVQGSHRYSDMNAPNTGARVTHDLEQLRQEINRDRAVSSLPAPTGLYTVSIPMGVDLHWNELPESYRRSIDGARIWRADKSVDDNTDFRLNNDKRIIVPNIRSTAYTDMVGNVGTEFIYFVQWINLDGKESEASGGVVGSALFDKAAPGPLEDLHVTAAGGTFTATWKDPLTNIYSLDNFAQQYSSTSSYTTDDGNECVTWLIGKIYTQQGYAPDKTYWFRYSAHNQSGDTTTNPDPRLVEIFPHGWGPWTEAPENPVSSGAGGPVDLVIPGPVVDLLVEGGDGKFTATWKDPLTGYLTIDNTAISWAENPGFTIGMEIAKDWGHTNRESSVLPGKTFYFRVAVHNTSGQTSDSSTFYDLGDTGWGPWTIFGAPDAVHSGGVPGAPLDDVIPSGVLGLSVTGLGGTVTATWNDPATGFATIDDVAIQYTTDAAFTANGPGSPAKGWGDVKRLSGFSPGTNYYWRVAVHNQSNKPSHASTLGLGATGWGPWTAFGAPTSVPAGDAGPVDTVIPGPVIALDVTGVDGKFTAVWQDPATGAATIDDTAISWATNPGFTVGQETATGWGHTNRETSVVPGKTYYWRVAVHNQSGQTSDSSTFSLGSTGWGPWTVFGAPTAVASGGVPGAPIDTVIPGTVIGLSVTGNNGDYLATWSDPATGFATIDDTAIQFTTDAAFTANGPGSPAKGWGPVTLLKSTSPGTTYYFRVAVHNQSNQTSHASTTGLGAMGWGPWTNYGAPTAVPSGGIPGAPVDTVIPGTVIGLSVTGSNGDFLATWLDPTTGNQTIDDVAIQYTTDSGFTVNGPGSPAKGWGPVNLLKSTSPETTYYWRVAVHNQSNQTSHTSTASLGATGWGQWTQYGAPTAVPSGTVPGAGYQSTDDNMCPNGSFEIDTDNDGQPDYCGPPLEGTVAGSQRITGGTHGTWCYRANTGFGGIAMGGFPVRAGDVLSVSCYAAPDSGGGGAGFYLRAMFHSTTREFVTGEAAVDLYSGFTLPVGWAKYEGQVTVPTNMHWCRISLYNYGGTVPYYFDNVVAKRVTTGTDLKDNTIPPDKFTGQARTEYVETFDEPLADFWVKNGGGTVSYPASGIDGGKVLTVNGGAEFVGDALKIPYDPRKLYKMTCRARVTQIVDTANAKFYMGVRCFDKNGTVLAPVYLVANALNTYPSWGSAWQELTGWFRSTGVAFAPAPDAANPTPLTTGTAWISPTWVMNWAGTAGGGNIQELDDIRIEIFDEQIYQSNLPNGTFGTPSSRIISPSNAAQNDNLTAEARLYWTYTQGSIKAQQFAIAISDGMAQWVELVRALPGQGALPHQFIVYGLKRNVAVTISVYAESVTYGGQTAGSSATWGTFTPSGNTGADLGVYTNVGTLSWAGGNVWYDSIQYRNDIAPSNGTSASITVAFPSAGSGVRHAIISNLTYTQGPYIATHLSVFLRAPSGTIVLNNDMVVARISLAALPASFTIPIGLVDNGSFTVAVVAVALTRSGATPNPTWFPNSKSPTEIWFQAVNTPKEIWLGDPNNVNQETIRLYRPLRMESPYATLLSYNGSTYQGGFSGDGNGVYMVNSSNKGISVRQGSQPNIVYGDYGGTPSGANCHYLPAGTYGGTPPSSGGILVAGSDGGGYWITSAGNARNFAMAGPHCGKCGYDFWLIAVENKIRNTSLHICGWCGARYEKGPKTLFHLLTDQEKSEILE